jgi:flagellar basal-body rod protein FlgF/flagellar basal-body rod protein FlgG
LPQWGADPVENALLVGLSRQAALRQSLDVIANNIANLNTTGFKADNLTFEAMTFGAARGNAFAGNDQKVNFDAGRNTWHDMSQGAVQQTGNPLDVAIQGSAFFAVQTPNGERYTRNGAFQINAQGQLVTLDGAPVLGEGGPITFQQTDHDINISQDGTIVVVEGTNSANSAQRGKLKLVDFAQPGRLQKVGSTNFAAPAGVTGQPPARPHVIQGAIEKSNVQSVVEMTRMIDVTRAYTNIAQMTQSQSDLRKSAVDKLSDVPT